MTKKEDTSSSLQPKIFINWPRRLPENLRGPEKLAISIDGKALSPEGMRVSPGPHHIVLRSPGYQPLEDKIVIKEEDDGNPLEFGEKWNSKQWIKNHHATIISEEKKEENDVDGLVQRNSDEEKKDIFKLKIVALVAFAAAVLFLILWLVDSSDKEKPTYLNEQKESLSALNEKRNQEITEVSIDSLIAENNENPQDSIEGALTYLDNNSIWKFEEMDNYPDLRGLYTDLEQLNWWKLSTYWANKLENSHKFRKIASEAAKNEDLGIQRVRLNYQPQAFDIDNQEINTNQLIKDMSNMRKEWQTLQ